MKKILTILLCVICLFLFGCNEDKADVEKYADKEIKKVMVYYDKDDCDYSVWIYMDSGERIISVYSDSEHEVKDTYKYTEKLEDFIWNNILTENSEFVLNSIETDDKEEQMRLWGMRISFYDDTSVFLFSTTQYPQQWQEFVELIEK